MTTKASKTVTKNVTQPVRLPGATSPDNVGAIGDGDKLSTGKVVPDPNDAEQRANTADQTAVQARSPELPRETITDDFEDRLPDQTQVDATKIKATTLTKQGYVVPDPSGVE